MIADGLYHVTNDKFSAAFRVENGQVTWCAPIIRKNISYWMTKGELIPCHTTSPSSPCTTGRSWDGSQTTGHSTRNLTPNLKSGYTRPVSPHPQQQGEQMAIVSRKIGPLADLKKKMAKGGGGGNFDSPITWVSAKNPNKTVRFLTELDGFEYYEECWPVNGKAPFPYAEGMREGVDYARKGDMYLANAIDIESDRVVAMQIKPTVLSSLMLKYEKYGTIMDRDYEISRYGEGLNTEYDLSNEGPSKRNLGKYDLLDLSEVVQDAYNAVFGSEDDESTKPSAKRSDDGRSSLKPRRRMQRGRPEPEEEEDESEEEEDSLYTVAQMREMDWTRLRSYARTKGVKNPSKRRTELIQQIIDQEEPF